MNLQIVVPCALLLIGCIVYIFRPEQQLVSGRVTEKTRLDYLRERKEVIYDNLRDLNFEYRAGKFPEEDYATQREALESEAAQVIAEMESLGG
jgi:hypothetical protein